MSTTRRPHALPRSPIAIIFALALTLAGLGCGGSPAPQRPTQLRQADPVALLPPDAEGVAVIDVATVRSAPFMTVVYEALAPYMNPQLTRARELFERIDSVALAFGHGTADDGREPLLLVARGSFRQEDLDMFPQAQAPVTHREHALRRDGSSVLAVAHDHTLLFGTDPWVTAALDRLDGVSPPAGLARPVLVDAVRRVGIGQHTITFASEVPEDFGLHRMAPVQGDGVSFGGWADLGEPIRMQAFGLFTDAATASAMAQAMRDKIAEAQESPELAAADFEQLFSSASIVAQGSVVDVSYSIDNDTFARVLLAMFLGFQSFSTASEVAVEEPVSSDVHAAPAGP